MEIKKNKYIKIQDLELYKLARELSRIGWEIYSELNWQDKKIMGDQFIEATDSFGSNTTEGYSRYHYLDKIKFMYNARASLSEANDFWIEIMTERKKVKIEKYNKYKTIGEKSKIKLQNFISSIYKSRDNCK